MTSIIQRILFVLFLTLLSLTVCQNSASAQSISWKSLNGPEGSYFGGITEDWDGTLISQIVLNGTYKSTDHGDRWQLVSHDTIPHEGIFIDIQGNYLENDPVYNYIRSTNKGQTWAPLSHDLDSLTVDWLFINRRGEMLATADSLSTLRSGPFKSFGLRSIDNGLHWIAEPLPPNFTFLIGSCTDSAGDFFISTTAGFTFGKLYRTTNLGLTWSDVTPTPTGGFGIMAVTSSGTLLVQVQQGSEFRMYRSSNHGDTWDYTVIPKGYFVGQIAAGPNDTVYNETWDAGGDTTHAFLIRSVDGGKSWSTVLPGLTQLPMAIGTELIVDRKTGSLLLNTYGSGMWRSDDGGNHWKQIDAGLDFTSVRHIIRSKHGTILAMNDYLGMYRNNGSSWQFNNQGIASRGWVTINSGYFNAHDGSLFNYIYDGLFRSTDDGVSWKQQYGQFDPQVLANRGISITGSHYAADSGSAFYAGLSDLYGRGHGFAKSNDMGLTWHALSNTGAPGMDTLVTDIEVAPDQSVYVAAGNGLYRSENGGSTWTIVKMLTANDKFESLNMTETNLFFAATDSEGILRSTDRGATWSKLLAPVKGIQFEQIAVPPSGATPSTMPIMVTANQGVGDAFTPLTIYPHVKYIGYLSTDGGSHWTTYQNNFQPWTAWFDTPTSLIVGTGFGGVWQGTITSASVAQKPEALNFTLSPNPARDLITLRMSLPHNDHVSIEIFDEAGRKMLAPIAAQYPGGELRIPISTSELPAGSYTVHLSVGGTLQSERFVVVR